MLIILVIFCSDLQKKMVQNFQPKQTKSSDHLLEDYQSLNSGKTFLVMEVLSLFVNVLTRPQWTGFLPNNS